MNRLLKPRNLALAGGAIALVAFLPKGATDQVPSVKPPGTKNIENRWSSGGGSTTHTPGAATPRGDASNTLSNQEKPKGIDTAHYQENQASQRPGEPGPFDKAWNQSNYGKDKGK